MLLSLYLGLRISFCVFAADSKTLLKLLLAAVWLVLCAESNVGSILSDYV